MSIRKTTAEKIEAAKIEKAQKEAEIKRLMQQQKGEERKARNHRLCERGGIVEKLLPDLIRLNKEQFDIFVQKTLLSGYAEKVLRGLALPEGAEIVLENSEKTTVKSALPTSRPNGANGSGTENATRQVG